MRISDWSSDVCSSDLRDLVGDRRGRADLERRRRIGHVQMAGTDRRRACKHQHLRGLRRHRTDARHVQEEREEGLTRPRSEEHTSELQSLMRISYAVFCLKKKNTHYNQTNKQLRPHTIKN